MATPTNDYSAAWRVVKKRVNAVKENVWVQQKLEEHSLATDKAFPTELWRDDAPDVIDAVVFEGVAKEFTAGACAQLGCSV